MRRKLVAGNWKMHGRRESALSLVHALAQGCPEQVDVAVCPPALYLSELIAAVQGSRLQFGGQDLSTHAEGAYTGELAGGMLAELGCRYVLVGHSERRQYHGESDALVAGKFVAAQSAGLVPVLCLGETLAERDGGLTESVLARQLSVVLDRAGVAAFASAVVAYEPVWAIGTGRTASVEQAQAAHRALRGKVAERDVRIADSLRILYGGSVKAGNAAELFSAPDVDGGLVGGASLKADEFLAICRAAAALVDQDT